MKFGLLLPLWFMVFPLFSQNCAEVDISPVRYFEVSEQGNREIHSYVVPCSDSKDLKFTMPSNALVGYIDPDPATPPGILLVVMKRDPGKSVLTVAELNDEIYRDINGTPLYFTDPSTAIEISKMNNLDNVSKEFVLMPIMVSNINGTDPDSWFEEDCVKLIRHSAIHLIYHPEEYELVHFDEISFINWPEDTIITDFFDFTFTDKDTDEEIPFVMTDNRSFRLQFPKSKGVFKFLIYWKNSGCYRQQIGKNWAFPTIEVNADTVAGFRNSDKCVPVRVRNFESVSGFYITFSWNTDSLSYSGIQNIHPALFPYLEIVSPQRFGDLEKMGLKLPSYLDTLTLPDKAVLFEWCGKPLSDPGNTVHLEIDTARDETGFEILGLKADNSAENGGIFVQEDREIIYDLNQLCNTRDGKHRVQLDVINDEAFPYTYSFHSPLIPDSMIHATPFIIPDVPVGHYEFTIRDSFGFEITEDFIVQEHIPPDFKMEIDADRVIQPSCINPFGGQIAVSLDPHGQNYQLQLLNGGSVFMGDSIFGLEPGNYSIEAEDEEGCVDTLNYTLNNPSEINVSWDTGPLVLCPGDEEVSFQLTDLNVPSDPSLQYQLAEGAVMDADAVVTLADPGSYPLQLWNGDGCTLDTTVIVLAGPEDIMVWDTSSIRINQYDTLNFTSTEPAGLTDISWQYNGIIVGGESELQYQPKESGVMSFTAVVYDRCFYIDSLMVQVIVPDQTRTEYEFPNAFTPNDDGVNDYYKVFPAKNIQKIIRMEVYDRYGNFVFQEDYTNEPNNKIVGWDGRHAGVDAAPGVYAIQVQIQLFDGREEHIGFDVVLIR